MKALITGIGGFVGRHLATYLHEHTDIELTGTTYFPVDQHKYLPPEIALTQIELTDIDRVHDLLEDLRPDVIYHLAAQASVGASWDAPWETLRNNIQGQLNLLTGMLKHDIDARILILGSGEEYGSVAQDELPITERHSLRPANPYSVSKVTQDMLGLQYFLSHNTRAIRVRPFNHIGPYQSEHFVAPDFAVQIAEIEAGRREPVIHVGNLTARRDFTDVRDIVRAYHLLIEFGESGEVYNVGSGESHSIQDLLDTLLSLSKTEIEISHDPERLRPIDVPIIVCDSTKLKIATGWQPRITFEQSLRDVLDECRRRVAATE